MTFIDDIAADAGAPADGLRLVFTLMLFSPLGLIYRGLASPALRHAFSIAAGLGGAVFVYGRPAFFSLGTALIVYALVAALPARVAPAVVVAFSFSFMISAHAWRHWWDPTILWDGAQMILTLKMISFAYNYADGQAAAGKKAAGPFAIREMPSLLEYFGYVYFYVGFMAGPAVEFVDYRRMASGELAQKSVPWRVHGYNALRVVASAVMFGLAGAFPLSLLSEHLDPAVAAQRPLWLTLAYMVAAVTLYRGRYYLCWSLAEAAGAWAGLGLDPATQRWDMLRSHEMHLVELPPNTRTAIVSWNQKVSVWLNRYIYQRVALSKSGKPTGLSTAAVFFVSAFWHGLNPGYYAFFLTGALYTEVAKGLRRRLRPRFHTNDALVKQGAWGFVRGYFDGTASALAPLYDAAGLVSSVLFLAYAGVAFEVEDFGLVWRIWASHAFLPHVLSIGLMVMFVTVWPSGSGSGSSGSSKKKSS